MAQAIDLNPTTLFKHPPPHLALAASIVAHYATPQPRQQSAQGRLSRIECRIGFAPQKPIYS